MNHLIAGEKKTTKKKKKCNQNLHFALTPTPLTSLPPLLFISHKLTHKNTFQSWQNMTVDECEHFPPHKWKWLICHSPSWVAFLFYFYLFFPSSRRNELHLGSLLLIAFSLPDCLPIEELYIYVCVCVCVCDKEQMPILWFVFWHSCPVQDL